MNVRMLWCFGFFQFSRGSGKCNNVRRQSSHKPICQLESFRPEKFYSWQMNVLYTSMYALSSVKSAYGEESNEVMWLVWKSGHYGQNDPSRNWTSGQILPSIIFWFVLPVTAEPPEMNVRLRLNFQIPKYLERENSRSEPVSQSDAPCCRIF